jgi:hypothetical protein
MGTPLYTDDYAPMVFAVLGTYALLIGSWLPMFWHSVKGQAFNADSRNIGTQLPITVA